MKATKNNMKATKNNMKATKCLPSVIAVFALGAFLSLFGVDFSVRDYGAKGDGVAELQLPFSGTIVVKGDDISADFAVQELNIIVSNATAKTFAVAGYENSEVRKSGVRRIFVGRSSEAERMLGTAFFDGLKDEESAVFAKENDLFLVGGGQLGCLYAVYDFVEDNLGFRHYFNRDDGFVVDKVHEVVWKGRETRKRPAFHGYRKDHHDNADEALFETRNRMNARNCEGLRGRT